MKKFIFIIITLLCFTKIQSQQNEKLVTIGTLSSSAPYCFTNEKGVPEGFAIDVIKNIMMRLGLDYKFKTYEASEKRENHILNNLILSECQISIITVPSYTNKVHYYSSLPYSKIDYMVISKKDILFNGLRDFNNKTIITCNEFASERLRKKFPESFQYKVMNAVSEPIGIKMLNEEACDYIVMDEYSIQNYRNYISKYNLRVTKSTIEPISISFASNDGVLIGNINRVIEDLQREGVLDKLNEKWLTIDDENIYNNYLYAVVFILLILTIIALVLSYTHRKVARIAKKGISDTLLEKQGLVYAINLLMKNSNVELYMFNEKTKHLSILKYGIFVDSNINLSDIERLIHPEDREQYNIDYNNIISGRKDFVSSTLRIFDESINDYRFFEHTVIPSEKNSDGTVTVYYYTRREITEIMKDLLYKEETIGSFKLAIRSANLIRWRYNIKNQIIKFQYSDNKEFEHTPDEIITHIAPEDVSRIKHYMINEIDGNEKEDLIIKVYFDKYDEYRVCNISSLIQRDKYGNPENIYGIINDITDIKKHHQKIEEMQANMQMALDAGKISLWRYDNELKLFTIIHGPGLTGGKMTMNEFMSYAHPEDKDILPNGLECILNGKEEQIIANFRLNTTNLGYKWYTCSLMPAKENGKIKYIIGTRRDITYDMESRIELERGQNRLQNILNKVPTPIYIVDPENNSVVYSNEQSKSVFGIYEGCLSSDIYIDEIGEFCKNCNLEVLNTGNDYMANEIIVFKNKEKKQTLVKKILINYNGKGHILISRIDLTEQEQLSRAQKLVNVSLPAFNAFTWNIDGRDYSVAYNNAGRSGVNSVNEVNTIDKCLQIIHPDDRGTYKNTLLKYIEKGEGEFNMIYRSRNSEYEPYQWWETRGIAERAKDKNEDYTILYGVTINVTPQKLTELSLKDSQYRLIEINRQNELILNNTSSGIVFINAKSEVLWSNLAYVKSLKLPNKIFEIGSKCEIVSGNCNSCNSCLFVDKENGSEASIKGREVDLGEYGVFHILATTVLDNNGFEGAVIRIDNITERVAMIHDLEQAKYKAEESERLKMAFLANMSHEIRTPLNAIVGFSSLLQEVENEEEREDYINIINKNNDLLLRLIEDILDLSKIESGIIDLKPEKFDFSECVQEIYKTWQQRNINSKIDFYLDNPYEYCLVNLDRNRVTQVMTNYISNAFKYTPQGQITIGYTYENNGLRIYVKDTGVGIPKDKYNKTFGRFAKFDDFAQGTGLGLAICKAITETCKGKVGVESQEGVGSEFFAWFPCESQISGSSIATSNINSLEIKDNKEILHKKINILVAEDNDSNYMLVKAILKKHNLTRAINGFDAVELAQNYNFDAILMDMRMPVMDGLEATRKIRSFNSSIPIIALTANAFDSDKIAAKEVGCTAFISKPLKKNELENILEYVDGYNKSI